MPNLQNTTLTAKGLYSYPNILSSVPDGALVDASNVVIDRPGVVTPRRGIQVYGNSFGSASNRSKQLLVYQNRILRHWLTEIDADSDGLGTFTPMVDQTNSIASVSQVDPNIRVKYQEANGNLYFTSSTGIRKISCLTSDAVATSQITYAGGIAALDGTAKLDSTPGWFTEDSTVAYRIVWGIQDANTNVILGAPSERIVIANPIGSLIINDFNRFVSNLTTVANFTPLVMNGTTHGNKVIDGISSTSNLSVGMTVTGTLVSGTITSITGPNSILISANAGNSVTESLTFGQVLPAGSYLSYLLPAGASALTIYNTLNLLAQQLDTNLGGFAFYGLSGNITAISAASPTHVTSIAHGLVTGDTITISNSTSSPIIDGTWVVTVLDVNTFTVPVAVTVAGSTATWVTYPPSIASQYPTAPISPTPTGSYVLLQNFYDAIINNLNANPGIASYALTTIGGAFLNSTQGLTVDLTFTVPAAITTAYFYQVYRSALFTSSGASLLSDITPDDELNLIFEADITPAQIAAKQVTFFDDVPDSIRAGGAYLYTNANSGEGIAQANTPPPLAKDIALFKGSTFYSNTTTKFALPLGLLTALGLIGQFIDIIQGSIVQRYTFVATAPQVDTLTAIAGNLYVSSGTSDYFDIFNTGNSTTYRIWFQSGTSIAPSSTGVTLIEIPVLSTDTGATVANNIAASLNATLDFLATIVSNVITITNTTAGYSNTPVSHVANVGFTVVVSTPGTGENPATNSVGVSTAPTPAQEIAETAQSLVRIINQNAASIIVASYVSGETDLPGLMEFQGTALGQNTFSVVASNNAISQLFTTDLGTMIPLTAISMANPTHITAAGHGFTSGEQVLFVNTNSTPSLDGTHIVTVLDSSHFTIPVNVSVAGTSGYAIALSAATSATNEVNPNRLFYSKLQQPEAVPLLNYQDVGPKNKQILRILPLRDSLLIFSEAGVYRLSGDNINDFAIFLSDSSTFIKCPDSGVVLNNQAYMVSNQGVVAVSDTGVTIVSRAIENEIIPLLTSQFTNFVPATFAVTYESDRAYILHTILLTSDTVSTVAYRYNVLTESWTLWDISKTCGVINIEQDILYYGPADLNSIEVERKQFSRLDQADRQYTLNIPDNGASGYTLSLGSLFGTQVGDAFVQTQNLTLAVYNRLLLQINTDGGLVLKTYPALSSVAGANLRDSLTSLATQLDSDTGLATHGYVAAIAGYTDSFPDVQSAFNVITTMLNADANTRIKTYPTSIGTTGFEAIVTAINLVTNVITLSNTSPFIAGSIVLFKQIDCLVTWAPHHFGDPSLLKQVTESTLLFQDLTFTDAVARYSSDLAPAFEAVEIFGEGTGIWGGFNWGQEAWGGEGTSSPFRTLIPADKQQCRYLNAQFEHDVALEQFAIFGLSITHRSVSNRGYR